MNISFPFERISFTLSLISYRIARYKCNTFIDFFQFAQLLPSLLSTLFNHSLTSTKIGYRMPVLSVLLLFHEHILSTLKLIYVRHFSFVEPKFRFSPLSTSTSSSFYCLSRLWSVLDQRLQ